MGRREQRLLRKAEAIKNSAKDQIEDSKISKFAELKEQIKSIRKEKVAEPVEVPKSKKKKKK